MTLAKLQLAETDLVGTVVNSTLSTTGLSVQVQFIDKKTRVARTPQSTTKLFTFAKGSNTSETILADSHSTTDGVTTITINSAGRSMPKFGTGTGAAAGNEHPTGTEVGCVNIAYPVNEIVKVLDGTNSTGANNLRLGDGTTSADKKLFADNGDANLPFIAYDESANQWVFSNDGSSTGDVGGGTGTITGGDGISITAGDVDIDLTDTVIFVSTSAGAGDTGKVPRLNGSGILDDSFIGADALADRIDDVTATATEINQALDGISANVTFTNLNTLTAGASSNADSLHSHTNRAVSFVALEALTAGNAVALLPNEVQHYAQLTDANLALGSSNTLRRRAVKFVPSRTVSTLTDLKFRAAEAVNGATATGTLTVSIQTDNAGEPSGTPVTNATATFTQTTQRTWNTTQATRTATFAGNVQLVSGTTYWIVWECAATDATNYINISVNSSHDENYATFTRLTYDLDAGTWGNSTTNATPFFWGSTESVPFGMGLVPTDANWGARTWNFIGFAKDTVAANASVDVYDDIAPSLTLVRGAIYYLSATAGGLTTTAPGTVYGENTQPTAFTYKIGRALADGTSLKISPGIKKIIIRESTAITATTTRNYVTWFRADFIRVCGMGDDAADFGISEGYATGSGENFLVGGRIENADAKTGFGSTSVSLNTQGDNGSFSGAASSITDIGFTYTYTETSTANLYAILEATA